MTQLTQATLDEALEKICGECPPIPPQELTKAVLDADCLAYLASVPAPKPKSSDGE